MISFKKETNTVKAEKEEDRPMAEEELPLSDDTMEAVSGGEEGNGAGRGVKLFATTY